MRSSTVDDSEDVRTSRVGLEAAQDIEDMVLNTGQTVPHSVSQSQPVFDYRSWPRLDRKLPMQDIEDMVLNTVQTVPHSVSESQPVFDYRSWPRLDVTMATRIQPSSTVDLGNYNNLRLAETRRNCVPGPHEIVSERLCASD